MNNKKKLLTIALTAVIILSLVATAVTSIAVPPENCGDTTIPENSAPGVAASFVENPAGKVVGIGAVTAFTITPDTGTATEVSEYYTAVVNTTGVSSLDITIPKGFEAVAPTSGGTLAEIDVYNATGTHGTLTITANTSDPEKNKIDVIARTEGASATSRGITVDYSPGEENTISGTYKGDYDTEVTLKLPDADASADGYLNISVPEKLHITNGSISIGQFVRNPPVGGDYVFTADGVTETVHITSITNFTITPDTGTTNAVAEYNAEVNTTGVSSLNITIPAGFEAVAPTSAGLIAEIDIYNATGTHGTITITANVSDPEENKIDVIARTEGASATSRGITVDYSPGAENTISGTYKGDYETEVTLKLPDASADGYLNISVPDELHITNGSISIGQFVKNPSDVGDYNFVAVANGETASKSATVVIEAGDTTAPYTFGHNPEKGATGVSRSTNIVVHVKDDDTGVDQTTIVMTVEGDEVAPAITGDSADYTLTYDPSTFAYSQVVDVTIDAADLAATPNVMARDAYSFTTESEPEPEPGPGPEPEDTTPPNIEITSPTDGQTFTTATITVSGIASDDVGLSKVEVKVNDGSWQPASGTSSWSKSVTLASGSNTIYAKATDTSENTKETSVTVTYNPPIGDITAPTWDTTTGIVSATDTELGGQVTVTYGTATDADSPPVKYNVYYNTASPATDGTKLSNAGSSPYTVTGLTNGQLYYFSVRVEDSAAPPNEDTNTVELTATPTAPPDIIPPTLIVTQPIDGQEFATSEIFVIGTVSDNVDLPQAISVTVNGESVFVEPDGSFSHPLTLIEGIINTITIVATDTAGNSDMVIRTVTYTPVVDTTAPMLIVTQPIDGQVFATSEIFVVGEVSDNVDLPHAINVMVNGDSVSVETDGSFSHPVSLAEGSNAITIVATDTAGNSDTVIRTVTYTPVEEDTEAPTLTVTSPLNNQDFATSEIFVVGEVSDNVDQPQAISVTVNDDSVSVESDGSFSYPVILTEDIINRITIIATDTSGNPAEVIINVTYTPVEEDTEAPTLVVTQPLDNQNFTTNEISVVGTVSDNVDQPHAISVTVDGDSVPVESDGSFSWPVILDLGSNPITIIATDTAGNSVTVTRTVTYTTPVEEDTEAPTLVVTTPINGTVHTNYVTVSGFATDDSGIYVVTVNGVPASLEPGGAFSFDLTLYEGANTITISAIDNSPQHNSVTVMRNVIYEIPIEVDTTPPTLIVNQPVSDQTFYTNLITVSGIASDMGGIQSVTVNGGTIPVASGGSFSTQLILVEGSNTIPVTATDTSDNIATVIRTVTYTHPPVEDTEAPTLIVNQPISGTVTVSQITVSGTAYDPSGIYSVTVNENAITVNPDGSFSTSLILVEDIANVITITAKDNSPQRNDATVTRTVRYIRPAVEDNEEPTLIVDQPAGGTVHTDYVTVSGSASDSSGIRSVTVNGVSVTLSAGTFGTTVWLNEGDNSIVISAVDGSSNLNTETVTRVVNYEILADTTPPSITVSFPTPGMDIISPDPTIHVTGSATDDTGIFSISVNGDVIPVDTSTLPVVFDTDTAVTLEPGSNTIVVAATDNSTNYNTNSISVTITYTPSVVEPGPAYNITLSANPATLIADGTDTTTIHAYLTDANGIAVTDGMVVSFTTTNGTLSDALALTINGMANVTLTSSPNPCTAVVTASSGSASETLSVPFEAAVPMSGWYWNVNMGLVHSPITIVNNCSVEISGGVMTIYTTTETAAEIGAEPESMLVIYLDTSTLNVTLQNPVVEGDRVTCTVSEILLDNAKFYSNFTITGIGIVESEIDVQFSSNCSLSGYTFLMTQHASIDDVNASIKYIIADSTTNFTSSVLDENTAQVLQAFVDGAKAGDIVNVSILLTVPLEWFNTLAGGDENNVWLFAVSDDGSVEMLPIFIVSQTLDTVTFGAYTTHFSVFALIAQPAAPAPPAPPAGGGGGGGGFQLDSDGDGYTDAYELLAGTDPNDPCDPDPECAACLAMRPPALIPAPPVVPIPTPAVAPITTPTPSPTPTPAPPAAPLLPPLYLILIVIAAIIAIVSVIFVVQWKKRKKGKKEKEIY